MKRILGMVLVMGMLASVAMAATNVTSVNAVGYNSVDVKPGKFVLVCLPFETFDDSNLQNIIGDQLPESSNAYIWDRVNTNYITATLARGGVWDTTNLILRGDAFWLKTSSSTVTSTVTFLGEVPEEYNNAATTTVYSIGAPDAVGYAYPTDIEWTNTTLALGAAENDKMYFWNEGSQNYTTLTKARGGAWDANVTIPAGRAFWFMKNDGSHVDWEEIVPYTLD